MATSMESIFSIMKDRKENFGVVNEECESGKVDESARFDLKKSSVNGKTFTVYINDKKYSYVPKSGTAKELADHFTSIAVHAPGEALRWLKKYAYAIDSYAGGVHTQKKVKDVTSEEEEDNFFGENLDGDDVTDADTSEDMTDNTSEEELDEATKVVVRDGKKVVKKVPVKKKRLTSAQKAALAKARKKAHTGAANKARAKSMKVRSRVGLNDEEAITCPECGFTGSADDFEDEDGHLICPECGCDVCCTDESCKNEEIDIAELTARLDECNGSEYMKNALADGKYDLVKKYLEIKEG